nr:MAG TPA: ribonucleotide-diphosphate reductase subunit alpha [Caudoviricetes sp.]
MLNLKEGKEYSPRYWWINDESLAVLNRGYLLNGETVEGAVDRITTAAAKRLNNMELQPVFKEMVERGWMSLSSPIWANMGTQRGLPISCVTGDTWINTDHGGKQAKDIKIGDKVLTHKNRFKKVIDIIPTKDKGDIWKLKVGTRMTNLYITGNHPVLTNLGWVRVDELDKDKHLVAVNGCLEYEGSLYTIDMKPFVNYKYILQDGLIKKAVETTNKKVLKRNFDTEVVTYYAQPREYVEITKDLAWAIGLWFAEGSLNRGANKDPNGIRVTLNYNKKVEAERWLNIMKDAFNLNGNISENFVTRNGKENKWLNVNINSVVIGKLFETFGNNCKEKEVPIWIINLPKEYLQEFLNGILLGDGTVRDNECKLTLSNPKLLLQVYNIALKLDKTVSLQMQEKANILSTTVHVYTIVFRNYLREGGLNNLNSGIRFSDGLTYCKIKTLEKTDKVEDVYDFTVEDDHSFSCAGVVVHNCFGVSIPDNIEGITHKVGEVIMQTKIGGGTSGYFGELRGRGAAITDNGKSSGAVSFMKMFDTTMDVVSQGSTRRGSFAAYLDIDHPDVEEFLQIKDIGNPIQNLFFSVCVPDYWMQEMIDGDMEKRKLWARILESRQQKGLPYVFFTDNNNKNKSQIYKDLDLKITHSNLCCEISLPDSNDESFVCCLSSMNLELYDEWKDTNAVYYAIYFLDAVMSEFIEKTEDNYYLKNSHNFAKRHRALGLGVLGYHSYFQKHNISFNAPETKVITQEIFGYLRREALRATKALSKIYGPAPIYNEIENYPEHKKQRNTTVMAIAPTTSSSSILGQVSPGIEPYSSNYYKVGLAKGNFIRKNKYLTALLESKGKNTEEVWRQIMLAQGSVQGLDFLTPQEKEVFKTFRELSQRHILVLAQLRQKYIDQGQSLNINIPAEVPVKEVNAMMIDAWKWGIKGLYYQRSSSVAKELLTNIITCSSCES